MGEDLKNINPVYFSVEGEKMQKLLKEELCFLNVKI